MARRSKWQRGVRLRPEGTPLLPHVMSAGPHDVHDVPKATTSLSRRVATKVAANPSQGAQ